MICFRLSLVICFALAFKSSLCGLAVSVGVAKVDVTPKEPVLLAGYGGRTTEHQGVDTPLWARALVIGDEHRVAVVALDNCGVPQAVTDRLAKRLVKHGISSECLVVAATHTHNAPTLVGYATVVWAGRTTPEQDRRVAEYTEFVIDKMEEAVLAALDRREPMQLEWAQGRATFGGNRRVIRDGKWAGFGFQRNGPVDHSMPVLAARDSSGKVHAVWANYACHCTTVGSRNRVGGDWAGFANEWMEKEFVGAVSLMTIGCGADVGPQPSGSLQAAKEHGRSIATEVKRLLTDRTISLGGVPSVVSRRIQLPLAKPKPREHWQAQLKSGGFDHQLAKAMLAKLDVQGSIPAEVSYPLSVWKFGDELVMVFLAGEVVVDYAVRLKRELDWSRLWINAWANDMPGYIPSRRVLEEGGYEADFSQVYYEQPGRYDPGVEDKLIQAVRE
ncbi:MAG TPA: neutral/alkaline non-lysosomal ceramidase N-terminal domain-containing protein, partial [Verrucomicrobiota bacterium]|nr:neutral/alkaline non-lysosomal ceramidase N-terminal domain-containing protein [Verrucomicrobiota bacterium]